MSSNRKQTLAQNGTPDDARPAPLDDDRVRDVLQALQSGISDPLSFEEARVFAERYMLREHAHRWVEANGKEVTQRTVNKVIKTLKINPEPEAPEALSSWLDGAANDTRTQPPSDVEEALRSHNRSRALWVDEHKRLLWTRQHIIVGLDNWFKISRDAPDWVLEGLGLIGSDMAQAGQDAVTPEWSLLRLLSMSPAQTVDRAARGMNGWEYPENAPPRFKDPRNAHAIEYFRDGVSLEKLREGVMQLNPRTADVWRLVTAASLEAWIDGQLEPPAVWVDVRELLEVMGYTKHHKGGYKPEDVQRAAQALADLDSFHIVIPHGAKLFPTDPRTGRRKRTKLEAVTSYKVLTKSAVEEMRDLFGNRYPMRWLLKPGEWIKSYPKHYAPLYRAIVELPAKSGTPTWAKALGTELSYQYRQDRDRRQDKKLKVSTLLERACLLDDARRMRNKKRVREYFEGALDLLKSIDVCEGWEYFGPDIDRADAKARGWFDIWLEAHVIVTAPAHIVEALPQLRK